MQYLHFLDVDRLSSAAVTDRNPASSQYSRAQQQPDDGGCAAGNAGRSLLLHAAWGTVHVAGTAHAQN